MVLPFVQSETASLGRGWVAVVNRLDVENSEKAPLEMEKGKQR
jgi:hypothetical protein